MDARLSEHMVPNDARGYSARAGAPFALEIAAVEKRYGSLRALANVSLDVKRGEFLTLLGPSGSGKTTLLKAIAGFEAIDDGRIILEQSNLAHLPPARREIGMVFQNYALFPHMTVAQNVAFPLRMRGCASAEIRQRVAEILQRVELGELGHRYPSQLSGGQQQRVALARAVVFGPKLLLLDEPFGALDRKLREVMQTEVLALQRNLGLTTVFITHDQDEALAMSDRIAVMRGGQLLQVGCPDDIYARPANEFVADFVGESNLLRARVHASSHGRATLVTSQGLALQSTLASDCQPGAAVVLLLRPEQLVVAAAGVDPENVISGRISDVIYLGNALRWKLETGKGLVLTGRSSAGARLPRLSVGDVVKVGWGAADGHLLTDID